MLALGETNIATASITEDKQFDCLRMQWKVRLMNGQVLSRQTRAKKGTTKGEIRYRARQKANELLRTYGDDTQWHSDSLMSAYVDSVTIPSIKDNDNLRPNTKDRYLLNLKHFSEAMKDKTIADAARAKVLTEALNDIAANHGTSTATQCRKVVSAYVYRQLVTDEVISINPCVNAKIDITVQNKATNKQTTSVALTYEEWQKALNYLLACDVTAVEKPRRGRYTCDDRIAQRTNIVEICMLQASTGMRLNECRLLTWDCVEFAEDGNCYITVTDSVSKTHKSRRIAVLSKRVALRLKKRSEANTEGYKWVFGSPAKPDVEWGRNACSKCVNKFLRGELARETGITKFSDEGNGSHSWRKTLSSIALQKYGISAEVRSATFGHSPEECVNSYTSLTDTSEYTEKMMTA